MASPGAAGAWPPASRRARARWIGVAFAVALLHLALLALLQRALSISPAPPAITQAPLVLVWLKPDSPKAAPVATPQRDTPPRMSRTPRMPRDAAPTAPTARVESIRTEAAVAPTGTPVAPPSAPAGNLLDTEATRRAIREAAHQSSTSELAARATGEPAPMSQQDKMGQEIARGARGDCLKGEYAGSGMGLLSLPFWLVAELRDRCRR